MYHARGHISIALLLLFACAATARADLSLSVDVGWSGQFRGGRWGPLFVTLADTAPRPVTLEVYSPHANGFAMRTLLSLSVSPAPATYAVYVPLAQGSNDLTVTVRDARTRRKLGEWPDFDQRNSMFAQADVAGVLIGTSGRAPTMRGIAGQTRAGNVEVVYVDPLRLPAAPAGYDAFNVLVLNRPDLGRLGADQQQAIADWIRAGGSLVIWPGEDPVPPASPLVSALPVLIGDNVTLEIDAALPERHGLPERFGKLRGRALMPKPGATRVATFGDGGPDAWRGRCGFGQVLVVPFDPTFFIFRDDATLKDFWRPLLEGFVDLRAPEKDANSNYYAWNDLSRQRRGAALQRASNELLGSVPGIGEFGFTYVAVVMIGLMIIVGPVDWLVLKYLGRQPWTWVTTSGWVALVTVAALFIGHLFKSGDLHFRTMRVIDQADGAVVATTDLVGVYAPRTRVYEIVPNDREGWWQPGADLMYGYGGGGSLRTDVPFAQDAVSNRLLPMIINVWNLRFLQGETVASAPPIIEASLAIRPNAQGESAIVGSISNRSNRALRNLRLRSAPDPEWLERYGYNGTWSVSTGSDIDRIEPGQTVTVDLPVSTSKSVRNKDWHAELWAQACDLAAVRSERLDRMLAERGDIVCIYADVEDPAPAVTITDPTAKQQHWQFVRALVPIKVENGENQ